MFFLLKLNKGMYVTSLTWAEPLIYKHFLCNLVYIPRAQTLNIVWV